MRFLFFLFFLSSTVFSKTTILSWNIQNFGMSKSASTIAYIAKIVNTHDIIMIQEVNASPSGSKALMALVNQLNQMGNSWDYCLSNPTTGNGVERYAYVFKKSVTLIGKPYLYTPFQNTIDREPFIARFAHQGDTFTLANIHIVPKSKHPEIEINQLYQLANLSSQHVIIAGDFNCPYANRAFNTLYTYKFKNALTQTATTIKMKAINGLHLANSYDNFYFEKEEFTIHSSYSIDFTHQFNTLKEARRISDHLPICISLSLNR